MLSQLYVEWLGGVLEFENKDGEQVTMGIELPQGAYEQLERFLRAIVEKREKVEAGEQWLNEHDRTHSAYQRTSAAVNSARIQLHVAEWWSLFPVIIRWSNFNRIVVARDKVDKWFAFVEDKGVPGGQEKTLEAIALQEMERVMQKWGVELRSKE